ncbi:MAG: hypothetical protein GY799_00480 [Desulfobulbaceae bacterium]|nr:hypothetical protein [Desulfobulbaceae bacterium]
MVESELDVRIVNEFNEAEYEGYEVENLAEYTEIMSRVKRDIVEGITFEEMEELKQNDCTSRKVGVLGRKLSDLDFVVYCASMCSDLDEDLNVTGSYLRIEILQMCIGSSNESALETRNYLMQPQDMGFTQY